MQIMSIRFCQCERHKMMEVDPHLSPKIWYSERALNWDGAFLLRMLALTSPNAVLGLDITVSWEQVFWRGGHARDRSLLPSGHIIRPWKRQSSLADTAGASLRMPWTEDSSRGARYKVKQYHVSVHFFNKNATLKNLGQIYTPRDIYNRTRSFAKRNTSMHKMQMQFIRSLPQLS